MTPWFDSLRESLVEAVVKVLKANAVHNRSALAPFRFKGLAQQFVTGLADFLGSRDEAAAREVGTLLAQQGLGQRSLFALSRTLLDHVMSQAAQVSASAPAPAAAAAAAETSCVKDVVQAVKDQALAINDFVLLVVDAVVTMQSQAIVHQRDDLQAAMERLIIRRESELRQVILELSTPIMPIADQVIVLPLIGTIDRERAQRITACLLEAIVAHRARVAILDISGVPTLNAEASEALTRTSQAAQLMGAQPVMVGISPEFAKDMAGRALDLQGLVTVADLRQGIDFANQYLRRNPQLKNNSNRRRA